MPCAFVYLGQESPISGYQHFTLIIDNKNAAHSQHEPGTYTNPAEQGEAIAELILSRGIKRCAIRNGWVFSGRDGGMQQDRNVPGNYFLEFVEAVRRTGLTVD